MPGSVEKYAAGFDQFPVGLVPEDMNILSDTNKTIVGQFIKDAYVPNSTFKDHIKTCISVSFLHSIVFI